MTRCASGQPRPSPVCSPCWASTPIPLAAANTCCYRNCRKGPGKRLAATSNLRDLVRRNAYPSRAFDNKKHRWTFRKASHPTKERCAVGSNQPNNLLASPGFAAWITGEPLDIQRLLNTTAGKPRLSIISIAHLSDPERLFFLTILLNELIAWMRTQSGTSSLRALLYMDEVFGFFPPIANRHEAANVDPAEASPGVWPGRGVRPTQNPMVILDYKGVPSNAGTWFLGRLQTESRQSPSARRARRSLGRCLWRSSTASAWNKSFRAWVKPGVPDEQRPRGPAGRLSKPLGAVLPGGP